MRFKLHVCSDSPEQLSKPDHRLKNDPDGE